jgi:putative addiction module component (TIGR02574 family)
LTLLTVGPVLKTMTSEQLADQLLQLTLEERVIVAEALWQSINESPELDSAEEASAALAQALRRDTDLTSGVVSGRTHEQVMEAARRVLGCG